eukprot:8086457-Heterocapsa_arctica.AAC.1
MKTTTVQRGPQDDGVGVGDVNGACAAPTCSHRPSAETNTRWLVYARDVVEDPRRNSADNHA